MEELGRLAISASLKALSLSTDEDRKGKFLEMCESWYCQRNCPAEPNEAVRFCIENFIPYIMQPDSEHYGRTNQAIRKSLSSAFNIPVAFVQFADYWGIGCEMHNRKSLSPTGGKCGTRVVV